MGAISSRLFERRLDIFMYLLKSYIEECEQGLDILYICQEAVNCKNL